jgi:hypothetical protein
MRYNSLVLIGILLGANEPALQQQLKFIEKIQTLSGESADGCLRIKCAFPKDSIPHIINHVFKIIDPHWDANQLYEHLLMRDRIGSKEGRQIQDCERLKYSMYLLIAPADRLDVCGDGLCGWRVAFILSRRWNQGEDYNDVDLSKAVDRDAFKAFLNSCRDRLKVSLSNKKLNTLYIKLVIDKVNGVLEYLSVHLKK